MTLPDAKTFRAIEAFSQASLQDYVDCPRRFQLRYLLHLAWPAPEAEPVLEYERHVQKGEQFHRMLHQHLAGIPAERLQPPSEEADMSRWWENYLHLSKTPGGPGNPDDLHFPEITLSAPIGDFRLIAKYDLISIQPGRKATIYDWKTSLKRPRRTWLSGRQQTRVYPYLLVKAGAHLNGGQSFQPEQIEMVYWFANFPEHPERFQYNLNQYHKDEQYLDSLIAEINTRTKDEFQLTLHEERCQFCTYRSLCQRGSRAGNLENVESEPEMSSGVDFPLDFEHISEIEF